MQPLANELVAERPDVILTNTTPVTRAVQRATRTIPVVFVVASDPVGDGFVQSLGRPGGNITGFINFEAGMGGKWLELLKQAAPTIKRASLMYNPKTAPGRDGAYFREPFEAAAHALRIEPVVTLVATPEDVAGGIDALGSDAATGVVMASDSFLTVHRQRFIQAALRNKLPAVYPFRLFAEDGGLLSYGPDYLDMFRRAGPYVDRVLQGASVADLPVQVPSKFELVINMTAARAIGLELPSNVLSRADELLD
jgi:putative ABC transport system substrate-binding protein